MITPFLIFLALLIVPLRLSAMEPFEEGYNEQNSRLYQRERAGLTTDPNQNDSWQSRDPQRSSWNQVREENSSTLANSQSMESLSME